MNNLFVAESNSTFVSGRGLSGTAQLTATASDIATKIIKAMNDDIENYTDDIKKSQVDNNVMDNLIERVHPLVDVDVTFLENLNEATLDGMLKSQQSKRSRCKSKAMTMDNYKALMTGAIAENLIRMVTGKQKNATGSRRVAGSVEYTIEQLQQLSEDQEKLKKEIRNVQSKKSIMRSKADFDESDERYQQLLKAEQQLKDMRVSVTPEVVVVDTTKNALSELLANQDLHNLKASDSKALLEQIANLIGTDKDIAEEI
jgi:hypothetical protein